MISHPVPTPSRDEESDSEVSRFAQVSRLPTPSRRLRPEKASVTPHQGTGSLMPLPAETRCRATPSHPVPTPSRTWSSDPVPRPPLLGDGDGRRTSHPKQQPIGAPVIESTSHVEQQVQARIAAARIKVQATKERSESLRQARRRGLARRHAQKLFNLAEVERKQQEQQPEQAGPDAP